MEGENYVAPSVGSVRQLNIPLQRLTNHYYCIFSQEQLFLGFTLYVCNEGRLSQTPYDILLYVLEVLTHFIY